MLLTNGWESSFVAHLPINGNKVTKKVLYSRSTHFGKLYGKELFRASNISLFLNANVAEIVANSKTKQVTQLRVSTLDGHEFFVEAQLFILATGGIENPRLLLASNRTQKEGLGNQYDLVGRFFMTHPEVDSGVLFPLEQVLTGLGTNFTRQILDSRRQLLGFRRRHKTEETVLNLKVTLHATYDESRS